MTKYKSIFISDVHLGSRGCKALLLKDFLKDNSCENLFLVGDIIDGWRLKRKFFWLQTHTDVVRKILKIAKEGTRVVYVVGNHDDAFRDLLPYDIRFGNIELVNQCRYNAVNGKRYMVIHGDLFDAALATKLSWLYHVGDWFYDVLLSVNHLLNKLRNKFNMPYWSLSAFLKSKTKEAVAYMSDFENLITDYAKKYNSHGVICGHIHRATIKEINGIEYMNDGDWVESCTALVEHHDGTWEIVDYLHNYQGNVIEKF